MSEEDEMALLAALVRRFLYYPTTLSSAAPLPPYARDAAEVWFASPDGNRLHGLHWPAPTGRPTLLYFHGNAQTVFEWALVRSDLEAVNCGLLLVDYPGYGKSGGSPREETLYAGGFAALDFLGAELGVRVDQVVLFGKSLGGGVATKVAAERPVAGVILESTFRSIPAVIRHLMPLLPVGALLRSERYESLERMTSLRMPVLVIHGTHDELIPCPEGEALFAAAPGPKELFLVPGAGHNDVSTVAGPAYAARIGAWMDQQLNGGGESPTSLGFVSDTE